jgi:hypothetical protein
VKLGWGPVSGPPSPKSANSNSIYSLEASQEFGLKTDCG